MMYIGKTTGRTRSLENMLPEIFFITLVKQHLRKRGVEGR